MRRLSTEDYESPRDRSERMEHAEDMAILGHGYTGSESDQRKMKNAWLDEGTPMTREDYVRMLKNWDRKGRSCPKNTQKNK